MTRLRSSTLLFAALPLFAVAGCSSSDDHKSSTRSPSTASCDEDKLGGDCRCDDGSEGQYLCDEDDALSCSCESDSAQVATRSDAGKKPVSSKDASVSTAKGDAQAPLVSSPSDASTGADRDAGSTPPILTGGSDPVIPKATGTCPDFKTGTMTIGGLAGIQVQAGPKKSGTGSLVFYWHGTGSNAGEANIMLPAAARKEILDHGGLIVSFEGSTKKGADCSGTGIFSQGDFEIADLIASCAVDNYGIDPRRIYTTGCSAGGLQSGCMAALRSSYIAAAVPNSGGLVSPLKIQDAKHVPSVMTMHGGSSDMVIVTFSQTSKTLDSLISKAGGLVINCDHGGGHCQAPADLQSSGWQFMKDHPFGVTPDPYAAGIPGSYPKYCMKFQ
ncbi:MAG: hypothetical protein JWN48_1969 [Myxococcaceae bacterium]|nr:hypothetical protein [Myxococcaceae bacterium]